MGEDKRGKKLRKPYTITKTRDRWAEEEHDRFLDALLLFGRDWKKVEDFVGTKSVIQIRSHAQKYFLKVQKDGIMAHVPPPRPKRKVAYPCTPKVSSNDNLPLQALEVCLSTSNGLDSACYAWGQSFDKLPLQPPAMLPAESACFFKGTTAQGDTSVLMDFEYSEALSSGEYLSGFPVLRGGDGLSSLPGFCNSKIDWTENWSQLLADNEVSMDGSPELLQTEADVLVLSQMNETKFHPCHSLQLSDESATQCLAKTSIPSLVMPNMAEAYNFIGNMIDPDIKYPVGVYLQKLKSMDPLTVEAVLLMIRNLIDNMSSPALELLKGAFSSYDVSSGTTSLEAAIPLKPIFDGLQPCYVGLPPTC